MSHLPDYFYFCFCFCLDMDEISFSTNENPWLVAIDQSQVDKLFYYSHHVFPEPESKADGNILFFSFINGEVGSSAIMKTNYLIFQSF